jgi:P3 major capsid protein
MPQQTASPNTNQLTPDQLNGMQRRAVTQQAVKMKQNIFSGTFNPATTPVINIVPRNVGLILRFIVEYSFTVSNTDGANLATLTDYGPLNGFSNIQFTDLQNNQRHNTYGFHFGLVSSFKERQPFASAQTLAAAEYTAGNNFPVTAAPGTITHGTTGQIVKGFIEIPIAYSDDDLRGAIYANVVANQMLLALTINPQPFAATGDDTYAMYSGATGTITSVNVNVYQEYYDQLPIGAGGVVLPLLDISTVYQLNFSNFTSLAANTDNYYQYTNFRRYMSAIAVYNNSGTIGGRSNGADISYWAQVSSNFTNIFKVDPIEQARIARRTLGSDPPKGTYYFGTRMKPIYTLTYGNMQLDINPITAGANAYLLFLWEYFALQNVLSSAGSLPANG